RPTRREQKSSRPSRSPASTLSSTAMKREIFTHPSHYWGFVLFRNCELTSRLHMHEQPSGLPLPSRLSLPTSQVRGIPKESEQVAQRCESDELRWVTVARRDYSEGVSAPRIAYPNAVLQRLQRCGQMPLLPRVARRLATLGYRICIP